MTDEQQASLDAHAEADAAGIVSHTSQGQPIPADTRLAMARAQTAAAKPDPQPVPPA